MTPARRNVELKARDADPAATLERALALGATDEGVLAQRDTYFGRAKGRLKLREQEGGTEFGLGANVYTGDLESAVRCMRELRAGTVWINDPLTDNDAGPFGGFKQSGLGRELGREGLEAFQETKHVHIETRLEIKDWWYPYG